MVMINEICIRDLLLESTRDVFETMIFMVVDEAGDEETESDQERKEGGLAGTIAFGGALDGRLIIFCPRWTARVITLNMLGMDLDQEVEEEIICDALGEIVNMIMGRLKQSIRQRTGCKINLSIPSVAGIEKMENGPSKEANDVSEESMEVYLDEIYPARLTLSYSG